VAPPPADGADDGAGADVGAGAVEGAGEGVGAGSGAGSPFISPGSEGGFLRILRLRISRELPYP